MEIEPLAKDNTINVVTKKGKNPHLGKSKEAWDDGTFKMCIVPAGGRNYTTFASEL